MFTSSSAGHHLGAPEEVGGFGETPSFVCIQGVGLWKYKKSAILRIWKEVGRSSGELGWTWRFGTSLDVFHECLSICTLVYYVFTMCLLCLYSPQHHTTPKGLGDHWKPGCKRQMWSSCVPAPSYSCASAPELSVLDHKSVGNIISPCPNSQKVARKNCSNSYRRVNSIGKFQYLHGFFFPWLGGTHVGICSPRAPERGKTGPSASSFWSAMLWWCFVLCFLEPQQRCLLVDVRDVDAPVGEWRNDIKRWN